MLLLLFFPFFFLLDDSIDRVTLAFHIIRSFFFYAFFFFFFLCGLLSLNCLLLFILSYIFMYQGWSFLCLFSSVCFLRRFRPLRPFFLDSLSTLPFPPAGLCSQQHHASLRPILLYTIREMYIHFIDVRIAEAFGLKVKLYIRQRSG